MILMVQEIEGPRVKKTFHFDGIRRVSSRYVTAEQSGVLDDELRHDFVLLCELKPGTPMIVLIYEDWRTREETSIALSVPHRAYLCNDNGKTIEKFVP